MCEQEYHGFVRCALGWAWWKTYVGRPETDRPRRLAMNALGGGLYTARLYEDALSVMEAELAMLRRLGASEGIILGTQGNLALTYKELGRDEEAMRMQRDVYFGSVKLHGAEHPETLREANNYANSLRNQQRFKEAESLMRKTIPVARRVLKDGDDLTLMMRSNYAKALYSEPSATLDELREAVTMLEDAERIARRVLGGAHPTKEGIEAALRDARAALRACETPPPSPWEAHRDDEGRPYYYNRETDESVWTLSDEILARETPSP